MNPDGSGLTRLTNQVATDWEGLPFAWSPDGSRIVLQGGPRRNTDIAVVNADGSGLTSLTSGPADRNPSWSPDGTRIVFSSDSGTYLMDPDGSRQTRLADGFLPAWEPNGTRIVFMSSRDGNGEVYVMNADGSGQSRLTNSPEDEFAPAWQPQP